MYVYVENIYPYVPSKQLLVFKIADRLPLSLQTHLCKIESVPSTFRIPLNRNNQNDNMINFALYFIRHSPAVSQIK